MLLMAGVGPCNKTGTRWKEDVGGLSRWDGEAGQGETGLVYILYNDDNAAPFFFESQAIWH
jgi:hypothetical protein